MANVVIVKTGNSLIVTFNAYASSIGADKRSYFITDIVEVELGYSSAYVEVTMRDAHGARSWPLTYDGAYVGDQYFIVDSIDAVAPTSESDLFDKITALR